MNTNETTETLYFIGGLFPYEREDEIRRLTKSGLQNAANNLQWKFVRGYDSCLGAENVHLLNSEYIGSFPKRYGGLSIPRYSFRHSENASVDIGAGFINLPVLKEFSRALRLKAEVERIDWKRGGRLYFVGYAATYPIVTALKFAKKCFPDSICCLIVPDLPQYMELSQKGPGLLHRIKNYVVGRKMRGMDCYVPLTAAMAPCLGTDLTHCAVVEGIADTLSSAPAGVSVDEFPERYILYTGTLQYRYGIGELLSAFSQKDYQEVGLVICGDGEAADEIRAMQSKDSRVRYLGVLPAKEIATLRAGATVLVNPRKNEGEYTKFSFPSKMMEYLASGVPTVAYKLDGMPGGYEGLFIDATQDGLGDAIERVLRMSPEKASNFAERARTFVLREKCPERQCEKTLELLRKEAEHNER